MMIRWGVLLVMALVLLTVTTLWSAGGTMSVQVKNGQLRATPSFLGTIVCPVAYGDRLETLQQKGDWFEVQNVKGQKGWIHESALTKKQIVLTAGRQNAQVAASSEELALAGKGFNADIEKKFRANNPNIDFTWVNKMEKITISRKEMMRFLKEGDIHPSQGGGQ